MPFSAIVREATKQPTRYRERDQCATVDEPVQSRTGMKMFSWL